MTTLVVDASVILKWRLDDEDAVPQAVALKEDFVRTDLLELIAPTLAPYEIANGLHQAARRGRITANNALESLSDILDLHIELRPSDLLAILRIAQALDISAIYDAAYVALAETEDCEFWTGDRRRFNSLYSKWPRIRWIGDYASPESR